jgi:hypothetical protein
VLKSSVLANTAIGFNAFCENDVVLFLNINAEDAFRYYISLKRFKVNPVLVKNPQSAYLLFTPEEFLTIITDISFLLLHQSLPKNSYFCSLY